MTIFFIKYRKSKCDEYCGVSVTSYDLPSLLKSDYQLQEQHRWDHLNITHVSKHYNDVIMSAMASQITSLTTVYLIVYSVADQRKHQSSASLAFVRGIHRWPMNSPHKGPVTRKMFSFDDVIMIVFNVAQGICYHHTFQDGCLIYGPDILGFFLSNE